MNIATYKKVFPILRKHRIVPYLHGGQGMGKTQIHKQIAESLGIGFITINLAALEVGDLVGLLHKQDDGTVTHSRPEWFPTEGNGIIFLDEINRMHPDVMQAIFTFVQDGRLHRHQLPPGWTLAAAGNYQNSQFSVTDMSDAAWLSRFCHIDFKPTVAEFITYAEKKGAESIAGFIRENNNMLEVTSTDNGIFSMITPDRRAWLDHVGGLEQENLEEGERFELYAGLVGASGASSFLTWKKEGERPVPGSEVVKDYNKVRERILAYANPDKARLDILNKISSEILAIVSGDENSMNDEKQVSNVIGYIKDIPSEEFVAFIDGVMKIKNNASKKITSNSDLLEYLAKKPRISVEKKEESKEKDQ